MSAAWGPRTANRTHLHDLIRFGLRMVPLDRDLLRRRPLDVRLWCRRQIVRLIDWAVASHFTHLLALVRAISYASMRMAS